MGPVLRGLRLRCPACGRAPLYRSFFQAHDACPACGRRHAGDRGDWTGGAEITLVLSTTLIIALHLVLDAWTDLSGPQTLAVLAASAAVLVPLAYLRVKGFWIGLVRAWEGEAPRPSPVSDPPWFTELWEREAEAPQDEPVRLSFRW